MLRTRRAATIAVWSSISGCQHRARHRHGRAGDFALQPVDGLCDRLERYFADRNLGKENFDEAENAAREVLRPVMDELRYHGWKVCVGASGTVQALQEIMMAGDGRADHAYQAPAVKTARDSMWSPEELEIEGLTLERALVFPSGAILIAILPS